MTLGRLLIFALLSGIIFAAIFIIFRRLFSRIFSYSSPLNYILSESLTCFGTCVLIAPLHWMASSPLISNPNFGVPYALSFALGVLIMHKPLNEGSNLKYRRKE